MTVVFDGEYFDGYEYRAKYGFNPDGPYSWSIGIGTVKVGQSKTVHEVHVLARSSILVVMLMMDDIILDKR